jgi:hypothetical protein
MPTRRTVISRARRQQISQATVELFKQWQAEDETKRTALEDQLHTALGLMPWQGPAVIHPDEICLHPPTTAAGEWHQHGIALYRSLSQAAAAR